MRKYPFPVVDGFVAVEHVNYLLDELKELKSAMNLIAGSDTFKGGTNVKELQGIAREVLTKVSQ